MRFGKSDAQRDETIGLEAAEWLLRLDDADDLGEFPDLTTRNEAFFEWIGRSPDHLRLFLETMETQRRMSLIDADRQIEVEKLLQRRFADVITMPLTMRQQARVRARVEGASAAGPRRRYWVAAAAVVFAALAGGAYWWMKEASAFTTSIGEQRMAKLDDGSFIYLNTDSRVEVDFTAQARDIRLVRGEALFVVERDSSRPFTVFAGDTSVRAIGTQFNVRRRANGADVAVIEGVVQISAIDEPGASANLPSSGERAEASQTLRAGEQAKIVEGRITPRRQPVQDALAWRERRLVFHDARLVDVAEEFNRYNRTKIRVEGDAAREIRLSGIFDADRPQALMLYAARNTDVVVSPEGDDWVIRAR